MNDIAIQLHAMLRRCTREENLSAKELTGELRELLTKVEEHRIMCESVLNDDVESPVMKLRLLRKYF